MLSPSRRLGLPPLLLSLAFLALASGPGDGHAQGRPPGAGTLREQASRLEPWTPVRVWLAGGERLTGRLRSVEAGGLLLEGRTGLVPLGSVDSLRVRGRRTRTGLLVGLVGGGAAGTAVGALIGAVVEALCEVDCAGTGAGILVGAGLGLLAGSAGGAGLGAVLGSAIPRWVPPGRGAGPSIGAVRADGDWSRLGTAADGSG
ncbi:MAG TPA: hypothetical protein VKA44_00020, partial [Gemmatimonadota bacterium]|nr:hypothetical protein [Gemmatimonadota bacterium]